MDSSLPALGAATTTLPAPLDPAVLDPLAQQAAAELAREGESQNTINSYRSALRYWAGWYRLRYGQNLVLPAPPSVVIQFIVDHAERTTPTGLVSELPAAVDAALVANKLKSKLGAPSLATLLHRLSVLAKAHALRQLANPCADPAVKELVVKTRRAYAKRQTPTGKKDALTKEVLQQVLATCDGSLRGLRDRALLLFAWASGGRRRSEVARVTMENLRRTGQHGFVFSLGWSKSNQSGESRPEDDKPVIGLAGEAMEAWLAASGIREGAVFRRIRRGDRIGEALSAAAVREIVVSRCAAAGVEGNFSAHSLRSGFVTEAGRQNVPLPEAMAMTGHASTAVFMRYYRPGNLARSRAANMLHTEDDEPADSKTS